MADKTSDLGSNSTTVPSSLQAVETEIAKGPAAPGPPPIQYPHGIKLATILACVYATVFLVALVTLPH